eukprot:scaffold2767_cov177-Amphora_coffeaeformis.AAC.18
MPPIVEPPIVEPPMEKPPIVEPPRDQAAEDVCEQNDRNDSARSQPGKFERSIAADLANMTRRLCTTAC